jgi:hypothetical protein
MNFLYCCYEEVEGADWAGGKSATWRTLRTYRNRRGRFFASWMSWRTKRRGSIAWAVSWSRNCMDIRGPPPTWKFSREGGSFGSRRSGLARVNALKAASSRRTPKWLLLLVVPGEAAVEEEGGAGGVVGVGGGEEDGHVGYVIGSAEAFQGDVFEERA